MITHELAGHDTVQLEEQGMRQRRQLSTYWSEQYANVLTREREELSSQ